MQSRDENPVVIDRAVLHSPTKTLRVFAHAREPLSYAGYCKAAQALDEQAGELGDIPKEIIFYNVTGGAEQIESFCSEVLRERHFGLCDEEEVHYCEDSDTVSIVLISPKADMTVVDLAALDEMTVFFEHCFENLTVEYEEPIGEAKHTESPKGKKQNVARTPSLPTGKIKGKASDKFLPGIARKAIYGTEFYTKKLDDIASISLESGRVCVLGRSLDCKSQITRQKDAYVMQLHLSDNQEAILVKWMASPREEKRAMKYLVRGAQVGVKGQVRFDARYAKENIIWAEQVTWFDVQGRTDLADDKRIELHAHTKMSMDGLIDADKLVQTAARFGHPAIAITDHGVVQAFPEAYMAVQQARKSGHDMKLIYGIEAYLANDCPYEGHDAPLDEFVVVDIETTGLDPRHDELLEIGAVLIKDGEIADSFEAFVKPQHPIPSDIVKLTGIDTAMVQDAPQAEKVLQSLTAFVGSRPVCAHNARFDLSFLRNKGREYGFAFDNGVLDTLTLSRMLLPQLSRHSLAALAKYFDVPLENHHRAREDAAATARIALLLLGMAKAESMCALNGTGSTKALPNYHAVILVKNKQGLNALYRLVTASHLEHFYRRPVMPKSLIEQNRAHLLIGSGCEQGEVFRAVLAGEDELHLRELAEFYDYLEIQPIENNRFLIRDQRDGRYVHDDADLWQINERIVELGKWTNKPVVATGDVHFLEPEDECFRRILMAGQGYEDVDGQPPLYLHTTNEMRTAFSKWSDELVDEVVINAPMRIAKQIEKNFAPFPDETFVPHEEGGETLVVSIATKGTKELYGDPLPPVVAARLEKELGSIIKHGFEVLYLSAHRLVKKSMEDGYSVGSRGSVGSSFIALAMGISEINPLPPHYRCPHCRYTDFDVADTGAKCGPDLSDRCCPVCRTQMIKDGFDIPFEVFLGFDGDKVPDIDLNFSGEYQDKAFAYVEEMFGCENVFRAGTVVGIKEKSAYGYVLKYLEEKKQAVSRAQIDYFAQGITGVKRTTGQHPGGLIVLPKGMDIHDFTPLQRPADNQESQTTTTHFDFNSLHDRLVKLDILGHDNPTMIRRLYEFTGIDPLTIPLDDPETLSLFGSCEALNIDEKTLGYPTGTLGIPEFGTGFVIEMLVDTKPKTIAELLQISGLSHGTDVWLGNARDLIRNGVATLSECICTRDNIMNYLLSVGVDPLVAFNTMERVRKGNGLTNEMETAMKGKDVPAWFIDSCKKIKYMFPKAHAAAYVLSALRIGYFKVHHPLAYYAAYFSVRGEEMDACKVLGGLKEMERYIAEIDKKQDASTRNEKERNHLAIAREMLLRGFSFLPPDLEKSHIKHYLIEDGKLRMPLMSVAGLGESAAQSVLEARKEKEFISAEDLRQRTRLNASIIEKLREVGTLTDLPDTAQMTFFIDMMGIS